jgi:hypothetical protein
MNIILISLLLYCSHYFLSVLNYSGLRLTIALPLSLPTISIGILAIYYSSKYILYYIELHYNFVILYRIMYYNYNMYIML